MNATSFHGKIAIVTGGASGIGQALCEELVAAGATVIVADIDGVRAQQVAGALRDGSGQAEAATVDVAKETEVRRLVDDTVARHGRIDLMFNNAGIAIVGEVQHMSAADWESILSINLHGVVHGVAAAYPHMVRQGFGHIVNTASGAGLLPTAMNVAYAATKFGVVGLSTSLRVEAEALGVRVSVLCPGFVQTRIYETGRYIGLPRERVLALVPGRMLDPRSCARATLHGVAKNKAVITVPFAVTVIWWIYRLFPGLVARGAAFMTKRVRALGSEED